MRAWVVRGGVRGENERYALEHSVATIGWAETGDLTGCSTREEVRAALDGALPSDSPQRQAIFAGQLWAFRDTIQPGDIVVMPLKTRPGFLAFGRCAGTYRYDATNPDDTRRHTLPVEWNPEPVSKAGIKDDLLYTLNSIMTVFSPARNNAVARLAQIARTGTDPGNRDTTATKPAANTKAPDTADEVLDLVTDPESAPTLEAIQDRIRTHLVENFAGHKLTRLVADILEVLGFECTVSPPGPDGGVDILAGTGPLGLDSPTLIVEVKSEPTPVGVPVVRGLHSAMTQYQADQALLVAWGGVTTPASREFAQQRTRLRIWDSEQLLEKLFATYDRLPASTRAAIPLRMAWVLDQEGSS